MSEANKASMRRIYEAINQGDFDALDDLYAPDFINHAVQLTGWEANKQMLKGVFSAFSKATFTIEEIIAEGDTVAVRGVYSAVNTGEFMGQPATGKQVTVPLVEIDQFVDGRLAEHRGGLNMWALMQQLGLIPSPEQN